MKRLVKGNEAVIIGALVAGCDTFFGYPITPASEIAHKAAEYFPALGKVFIQAESEVAAMNMVLGASSAGRRAMTASSGPGISLKQEAISFMAGSELPCVVVDIMRAGPGLGNIGPEQSDYFQITKGGGHGDYRNIVLAPCSVQEMYSMTANAFDIADRYRNPVFVLADATLGQMMEPIKIEPLASDRPPKPWQLDPTPDSNDNLITSIFLDFDEMEQRSSVLAEKYRGIEATEARAEVEAAGDAPPAVVLSGYGIVARLLRAAARELRARGVAVSLVRPKTLWPFPRQAFAENVPPGVPVLVAELSRGQFVEDVRLALPEHRVAHIGRYGGNLLEIDAIVAQAMKLAEETGS